MSDIVRRPVPSGIRSSRTEPTRGEMKPHDYMQAWVNLTYTGHFLLSRLNTEMEETLTISLIEQELLGQVAKAGGEIRMVDLARHLWVTKAAVTNIVDRLEERGLCQRSASTTDRRAITISLTDEGEALLAKSWKMLRRFVNKNFRDQLDEEEILELSAILQKLLKGHDQWDAMLKRLRGFKR